VTAVEAPRRVADLIGCPEWGPVLRIERVHFDREGRPVGRCVNYYNAERYTYRLQLRRR